VRWCRPLWTNSKQTKHLAALGARRKIGRLIFGLKTDTVLNKNNIYNKNNSTLLNWLKCK
jgi:hypothetical protein